MASISLAAVVCLPYRSDGVIHWGGTEMRRLAAAALAGAVLAGIAIPASAAGAAPGGVKVSVVRSGLNAPRHLAVGQYGLWVAQAGAGGPAGTGNCVTGPSIGGPGTTQFCVGTTGAAHPQPAWSLGTAPGETAYDSDPFDVIAYHGGWVVADAAANSLLEVSQSGHISLLARFPAVSEVAPAGVFGPSAVTVKAQAVPTSIAVGPDGALYVGLLRGVPSDPGTAYIYRVVPGHQPTIWARGLTAVTGIAFDQHGRLLATEYSTAGLLAPPTVPGALVRISRDGHTVTTLPVSGLFQPTGIAVGSHGTVYVSNYGDNVATSAHPGQILKITGLS
jgi:hypothetical protein